MSDVERTDDEATFGEALAELFAEEAHDAGIDRLMAAARSGDLRGLSDDERATLADFGQERAEWRAAGLPIDLGAEPAVDAPASTPAPPGLTPTPPKARPASRRSRWAWIAAAVAAVALAFALWPRPPETEALRAKGPFELRVTVVRPDGLAVVAPGERLVAGDRVGLAASVDVPGYLWVYALGDDGPIQLHPAPGAASAFGPADDVALPTGAALTPVSAPTCEYVVGVFMEDDRPQMVEDALRAAHRAADGDACVLGPVELPDARVRAIGIRR